MHNAAALAEPIAPAPSPTLTADHIDIYARTATCPVCGAVAEFKRWKDSDERGHFWDAEIIEGGCDHLDADADSGVLLQAIADANAEEARWGGDY